MIQELVGHLHETLRANQGNSEESQFDTAQRGLEDLVHDLRQPLSAIESLTYYLELVSTDMQTRMYLESIQKMVMQANHILERAVAQ
jgi:signal transduction histidine kinase